MSTKFWQILSEDQQKSIFEFYRRNHFPMDIRLNFDAWIEKAYRQGKHSMQKRIILAMYNVNVKT